MPGQVRLASFARGKFAKTYTSYRLPTGVSWTWPRSKPARPLSSPAPLVQSELLYATSSPRCCIISLKKKKIILHHATPQACQIAKIKGCRVIALAGGPDKCKFLKEEIGVDEAIDYKNEKTFKKEFRAKVGYLDVYFDNVGGEVGIIFFALVQAA
jgi:hypothetical protein